VEPAIVSGSLARLPQPSLELNDLLLRPWQASDAPSVVEAYSEPSIRLWHVRSMTGQDEARAWIDSWPGRWNQETGAGWAVVDASGLLGQISLRSVDFSDGRGEVSYWVLPAARGRRVATRALCAMSDWLFEHLGLHRLEVTHSTMNPASCRVADNAAFPLEGTMRGQALHVGGWHDMHLHARVSAQAVPRSTWSTEEKPPAALRNGSDAAEPET
jgi:[ribosomal protein S5]-alanine N-acetyltransferase